MPHPLGKPTRQRLTIARLELMKSASNHQASNDFASLKCPPWIARDESIEVAGRIDRLFDLNFSPSGNRPSWQCGDDRTADLQRILVIVCQMVAHTGQSRVHI